MDFNFFGHQLSLHLGQPFATTNTGKVGAHMVPMPHMGLVLLLPDWQALAARLTAAGGPFELQPSERFQGEMGEQWTMLFRDPSGNPIEIKGFPTMDGVFAPCAGPKIFRRKIFWPRDILAERFSDENLSPGGGRRLAVSGTTGPGA